MKKILASAAALLLLIVSASADEGMWLLPLINKMNSKAMSERGCKLSASDIYSINSSSLKDAIVHFGGGCTGEIISDKGLLVTNHHCGYSHIQGLSSPEHNYLEDGYWAMNSSEELPVPGLTVTFLEKMTDVTDVLNKAYDNALKKNRRAANAEELALQARKEAEEGLIRDAEDASPFSTVSVVNFYNDNVFYLIVNKVYRDVRFVGAPPASSGKFGGETDNWMWPRHTCDFSMFRVYAGKGNEPADYSPENKPYHPKKSLKISLKGVEDGDYAMIMGYPGRTQRFMTAAQLGNMLANNDVRVAARTERQQVMWAAMRADEKVSLQYASKYASSSNGCKKWIGMKKAFENLDIIGREKQKEEDFMKWVNANKKRKAAYGGAISDIEKGVSAGADAQLAVTLLTESVLRIELPAIAVQWVRAYKEAIHDGRDSSAALEAARERAMAMYKDYDLDLDIQEAKTLLRFYMANVNEADCIKVRGLRADRIDAFVDSLYARSAFSTPDKMMDLAKTPKEVVKDPAVRLYNTAVAKYQEKSKLYNDAVAPYKGAAKTYTAGLMEWKKKEPSYPDANSTMRLTYGNVKSYTPRDGVLYKHYTTLKGVMEKEDPDNYEFRVPARLKQIYKDKDFGQYANAKGELPTCFLINCDITGGNSGSPVLNAKGELIGLAFDGNWESMSSDVMFEPDLQRCICVDIRYVLLMMDRFGCADYLLKEMNIVKK